MASELALPAHAADYSDPSWPCVQRKVETLSLGLMWPFPLIQNAEAADEQVIRDGADLADTLALRRVDLDDVDGAMQAFVDRHGGSPEVLGLVFGQVFDTLSTRRTRIINGIGDFSLGQISLSKRVDSVRAKMDIALAAADPDYDKIDVLEEQLDWDQIIYTDRQRSITYLCETPTLLERRLFRIAQMLQHYVPDEG
ncbi:MAG: hypothetical protein COB16_09015 [Rhodobacteraceae bacterium]|nr:MAG: hypothetical protein COB16_09015 [Paracoccaceae bacterium]